MPTDGCVINHWFSRSKHCACSSFDISLRGGLAGNDAIFMVGREIISSSGMHAGDWRKMTSSTLVVMLVLIALLLPNALEWRGSPHTVVDCVT